MLEFLPEDVRQALIQAQDKARRRSARLSVQVGGAAFPVLRLWDTGFAVDSARVPRLRGLVDLFDGPRHLSQCLIVAAAEDGGTMVYEFKRETVVLDRAPLDYERDTPAPSALLPRPA